ncbi:hypothetical protein FPOAC1_009553 [Fusarium poae]|nr:hypothetical protein FPOAC1_009553 [Fusarium poae]KAG8670149.1 hypothetical protein FPOAC1_009553 [Fusarium poae]
MTAPTPFKRTVTGLVETSSSSTRDQSNTRGHRMAAGNGPDGWTQASTPGRRKAPTAVMDDMWDVPSSPDDRPVKPKIKIKVKRSVAQSDSTSDSQRAKESGRMAKTPDSKSERPGDSPSSKRKRRKVDYPEPSFQGSNDVDLISMPFNHDHEGEDHGQSPPTPSMLPPTMPVNEDISFFIAPNPLTDTQRMEYESMQLPSSDSPPQLPFVRQFNIQNIASSSEATNVNTPRSNTTYLMSTAPPPPASLDPPRTTIGQATGNRWDSSPDVIAAIDSPPPQKTSRLQEQSTRDDAPEPIDNEFVELHQADPEQTELPIIREATTDSYESEKMAKPTKAKKSRGRPKKKAAAEPDITLADSLLAPPEAIESVTKPKKKRGRPRKSDAQEESLELDQSLSTNDASLSEDAVQPEKRAKIDIEETETRDELAEDDEAQVSPENKGPESPALEKPEPNLSTRSVSSIDDGMASKNSDTPRTAKQKENPTISSRSSTPSKGLSSIINKPVYRVGLSKKSRIAPLLKCLRKE